MYTQQALGGCVHLQLRAIALFERLDIQPWSARTDGQAGSTLVSLRHWLRTASHSPVSAHSSLAGLLLTAADWHSVILLSGERSKGQVRACRACISYSDAGVGVVENAGTTTSIGRQLAAVVRTNAGFRTLSDCRNSEQLGSRRDCSGMARWHQTGAYSRLRVIKAHISLTCTVLLTVDQFGTICVTIHLRRMHESKHLQSFIPKHLQSYFVKVSSLCTVYCTHQMKTVLYPRIIRTRPLHH